MKVAVICALELEFDMLVQQCHATPLASSDESVSIAIGEKQSVIIVQSGIGNQKSNHATRHVLHLYPDLKLIISAGIAGALDKNLAMGDIVAGHIVVPYTNGKVGDAQQCIWGGEAMAKCLQAESPGPIFCRIILSSDTPIADSALRDSLYNGRFAPACVEMESVGVLDACHHVKKPFLAIKSISDAADGVIAPRKSLHHSIRAAHNVSKTIVQLLSRAWE